MISRKRTIIALVFVIFCAAVLSAVPSKLRLMPDFQVSNSINLNSGEPSRRFRIVVPDDVFEMRIRLSGSQADLDLYLYDDYGDVMYYSEDTIFNEELVINRMSRPSLYTGEYEIEVLYQLSRAPVIDGVAADSIDFSIEMDFVRIGEAQELALDQRYDRTLLEDQAGIDLLAFDLPEDARQLRIDVFNTEADLDFSLNPGFSFLDPYEAAFSSASFMANEHAVYDLSAIEDRRFYLMVMPGGYEERDIDYSVRISTDPVAPSFLYDIPALPRNASGMQRNLLSTVEVSTAFGGGSGTLISADGYLLTNHHVIVNEMDEISDEIAIGITLDERRPARELFLAEVIHYDADIDIALLKITSGLYGQPLPENIVFPHFQLADLNDLNIGDNLTFLGYPNVGGLGSKPTITLTRGVLAGFEDLGDGLMIKTDGEINFGNSGGAALSDDNRLIGLPTQLNPDSGGKLAFIHTLDMIPRNWFDGTGIRLP